MNKIVPLVFGIAAITLACVTQAGQPRMHAALRALQDARSQLQDASADKGGHRVRALQLVDQALAEVRNGIEYDRTHLSPGEGAR
jgi:uncharacterized membrane protein YqiK